MVSNYDAWLAQRVDDYLESSICDGEPRVIRAEKQYEPDGYSMDYIYNCEECDCEECEHWSEYNERK